jgi:hypothetical protein
MHLLFGLGNAKKIHTKLHSHIAIQILQYGQTVGKK